ncbi:ATPase, T2SS/T4P/T4SS family [Pseudoduganella sp. SL102]|uniref:GspE/PulE family protein n=1 Tax=Pseudoduganella sp. SL102 TaxID=2995154 RepID=UPI00248C382C|nr:ATPase, T2SS/T4P/T4SS family [Pseudoduganella sp. SL102]WBS01593.1 ATPase, T2SS/T4P/T4SS family [Pseudoduganella sp. SL102]
MSTLADGDTHMPFLRALAAVVARLRDAGSLDEVMADPAGTVAGLFACDRFTLYAVDAEGDYLVSKAKSAAGAWRDVKVAISPHGIAGHVAVARRAVNIADAYDDAELARIAPGLRFPRGVDQRTGYRTRQVLAVPVLAPGSGALLGVIQLVNTRDGAPFPEHALAGATELATALAEALGGAQKEGSRRTPPPPAAPSTRPTPPAAADRPVATRAVVPAPAGDDGARLLARIVADAQRLGAAAIHVEAAGRAGSAIRLRRDGVLAPYASLPPAQAAALAAHLEAVVHWVSAAAGKPHDEKPHDGKSGHGQPRYGTLRGGAHGLPDVVLHAATLPSTAGMDVVLRIAAPNAAVPLARLGMAPDDLSRLRGMLGEARGLLLVCAPADSGKSTTLHALLAGLNHPERKICTAEDPVTLVQPGLRQVHAGRASNLAVAAALEAFRQADADVIMVDAPCDVPAAGLAVEAALSGRLVLAALPARNAVEGARRLLDMAADPFGAAAALAGVLAQRLARKLCTACRQPYHPGAAELDLLLTEYCAEMQPGDDAAAGNDARVAAYVAANNAGFAREEVLASWRERHADAGGRFTLYRAVGCAECRGGYRGRAGLFELMTVGERTARLLARRGAPAPLAAAALEDGMRTLKMDGIDKVLAGITDIGMVRAACARQGSAWTN